MLISVLRKYGLWKTILSISLSLSLITTFLVSLVLFIVQGYIEFFAFLISFSFPFFTTPLLITGFSSLLLKYDKAQIKLNEKNKKLEDAVAKVEILSRLLPICSYCKKIRDDEGYWNQIEEYLSENIEINFEEEFCPSCKES